MSRIAGRGASGGWGSSGGGRAPSFSKISTICLLSFDVLPFVYLFYLFVLLDIPPFGLGSSGGGGAPSSGASIEARSDLHVIVFLYIYRSIYLSIYLSIYFSLPLSLCIYLSLPTYIYIYTY